MSIRLLAAIGLFLSFSGCSAVFSGNPAKCDLAAAPDSRHCAAKEASLTTACQAAKSPDRQKTCDEVSAFRKDRLEKTLLAEVEGLSFLESERASAIASQAVKENLEPVAK